MMLSDGVSKEHTKLVAEAVMKLMIKFMEEVLVPKSRYELTDVVFRYMAAEYSEAIELIMISYRKKQQILPYLVRAESISKFTEAESILTIRLPEYENMVKAIGKFIDQCVIAKPVLDF